MCEVDGCDRYVVARGYCGAHYKRWWRSGDVGSARIRDPFDPRPTPHADLTYAGWHRNMQPMPSTEPHEVAQRRYAAQNERDGYTSDPEYLAAVRAWRDEPIAAD